MRKPALLAALTFAATLAGCNNTAVNVDRKTTFLNSDDMVTMTNRMAQSIIADPRIQAESAKGPLKIVIRPVDNLTDEIIPGNEAELFVARLQGLLASRPELANRFIWCVNRSDYAKLQAERVPESKIGPSEDRVQPEYQLYAEFRSATNVTRKTRSDTYLCHYKLTRISNGGEGLLLWLGEYETSKAIKKGFLD
ncbi:MAG TPA: hypothetical protein VHM90_17620 [Phycisphaerae bacterium]|jgi:hypothetical protein|nr:hypothetical protein [Phycisphaerae bacterium]